MKRLFCMKPKTASLVERIKIRNLRRGDLPALEWEGEYIHFRRIFQSAFRSANEGASVLWIAELPGSGLVGQLFVQLYSSRPELADGNLRAYIYGFRIRPAYRGQGIGTRMMETAEEDLSRRGFSCVTLNVARDNPDARRLYERLGYRVVADEPGIWSYFDHEGIQHHVNEPSWRMEKPLRRS